jgi:hypothetical protein
LCYHSKGGFNQEIAYNLPVFLRNFYYNCLIDAKKAEQPNDDGNSSKNTIATPPKVK